jgi:hypothetical protein
MKYFLIILVSACTLFFIDYAISKEVVSIHKSATITKKMIDLEKSILCDDKKPKLIKVTSGRVTVLNFPFKPKEVVLGSQIFDFKQIKNDLVIMAMHKSGQTNVVIYLEERRCIFNLLTVFSGGDDILIVKDPKDSQFEVRF